MAGLFMGRGSACNWCGDVSSSSDSNSFSDSASAPPPVALGCNSCTGVTPYYTSVTLHPNMFSGPNAATINGQTFELSVDNSVHGQPPNFSCFWQKTIPAVGGGNIVLSQERTAAGFPSVVTIFFSIQIRFGLWTWRVQTLDKNCLTDQTVNRFSGDLVQADGTLLDTSPLTLSVP